MLRSIIAVSHQTVPLVQNSSDAQQHEQIQQAAAPHEQGVAGVQQIERLGAEQACHHGHPQVQPVTESSGGGIVLDLILAGIRSRAGVHGMQRRAGAECECVHDQSRH